jgi:pimeloyl-ACP methyl ester carboxylesterase
MTSEESVDYSEYASPDYDEFSFLERYAAYEGIPWHGRPAVRREYVPSRPGQLSGLAWGSGSPGLVFLHGAGQNAHTWDSVAMALDRPLLSIDLPGHGHSDWREDKDYRPAANATAVASWLNLLPARPFALVGMSLGGLTSIALTASGAHPVACLTIVDVTPGLNRQRRQAEPPERNPIALIRAQQRFASFPEMLHMTASYSPGRPVDSLLPGVRHNARQLPDGRWAWRYDSAGFAPPAKLATDETWSETLWDALSALRIPIMLVRGGRSPMVTDEHAAEFVRRQPRTRVEVVDDAGHSVQSDRASQLAALIDDFTKQVQSEITR